MSTLHSLETVWQDLRYAVRQLRLSPGFAITAIVSLALGIGANTAIFQLLNAVRLRSLPVQNPDELAEVKIAGGNWAGAGLIDSPYAQATYPLWEQIRRHQAAFSHIFAWSSDQSALGLGTQFRQIDTLWLSGDAFQTLGVQPYRGRVFGPDDDHPGCASGPVVISYAWWQREYQGRNDVIGSRLVIEDKVFHISGVTPLHFFGMEVGKNFDVAIPLCARALWGTPPDRRDLWWLMVVGRLKPGWSLSSAGEQLKVMSRGWFEAVAPSGYSSDFMKTWYGFRYTAEPGGSGLGRLRSDYESSLWLLLAITGLVLLIACANLANLLMARAAAREREIAVRISIGASRGRLIAQSISESLLLAAAGAVLGAGVAAFLSRVLVRFISTDQDPFYLDLGTDWRMLAFTAALTLVTCLLFGLAPSIRATCVEPASAMKAGGRSATPNRRRFVFQQALIAAQIAICLVLVGGALLFVNSFRRLMNVDAGFRQEGIVATYIDFHRLRPPPERIRPFGKELIGRVRAIPGIEAAAASTHTPLTGSSWTFAIRVPGFEQKGNDWSKFTWISPGYFEMLHVPLIAGRDFNALDTEGSRKVMIISETFAGNVFGARNPIGRNVISIAEPGFPQTAYEIVGVAKDIKYNDLREKTPPVAYVPETQNPEVVSSIAILTRSSLPAGQATVAIQKAVASMSPEIFVRFEVVRRTVEDSLVRERTLAWLSGFFGALAALLAMIGLYGVISYMMARRRSEIGIRLALGATRTAIIQLVLRQVSVLLVAGLGVGAVVSLLVTKSAENLLYGLKANDPAILCAAMAGLSAIALAATFVPALRASKVDPMTALREE